MNTPQLYHTEISRFMMEKGTLIIEKKTNKRSSHERHTEHIEVTNSNVELRW